MTTPAASTPMTSTFMVHDAAVAKVSEHALPGWLTDPAGPLGPDAVIIDGQRLRYWGLSEVWRIQLVAPVPRSVIVKRGTGEMAVEAGRYQSLVVPLGIVAPRLLAATGGVGGEPVVLVLEDVGQTTLEERPTAEGYREAVRGLARMRATAARSLAVQNPAARNLAVQNPAARNLATWNIAAPNLADQPAIGTEIFWGKDDFVDATHRAASGISALRPDLAGALDTTTSVLVQRLDRIDDEPNTIVHGDFQAKNLIHADAGRIIAVDWPGAYIHSHLGDLYCLIRDADRQGLTLDVDTAALPKVFAREAGMDRDQVADQLITGGLCWTILALRWVVEEGIHAVPESRDWIEELVTDCRRLSDAGDENP